MKLKTIVTFLKRFTFKIFPNIFSLSAEKNDRFITYNLLQGDKFIYTFKKTKLNIQSLAMSGNRIQDIKAVLKLF